MANKIRLKGLGHIVLVGTEKIEPEKDYLVSLRVALRKIEKDISDLQDPVYTFICEYLNTELVQIIGDSRKIKVEHGKTSSQKLRWVIQAVAELEGKDPEQYYQQEMSKLIENYSSKLED